ncbi:MAG: HAD family hydrolase [Clostridia bacterium]|nr:HAD family hydrolase [Clostridia bacterium]
MRYNLVIFDLDGTLLNTLDDLADAGNRTLTEIGLPTRPAEEVRAMIGGGVGRLIRRLLPEDTEEAAVQDVIRRFKANYAERVNVHTAPYPGIPELVRALRACGIHTACNSNKLDAATQLLCRAHFGDDIELALGERDDIPRKPAPDGALRIMRALGAEPSRTLYVGDGDADILTAQNAGVDCAWVTWGYRRREEFEGLPISRAFDSAEALQRFILEN